MMSIIYECEDLDYRGYGVSKSAEKVTFIKGLLPGETATIKNIKDYNNYQEGEVLKILQTAKIRKSSNDTLDHMPLSHLEVYEQIKFQAKITKETLEKSLKKEVIFSSSIFDNNFNYYRNKATYHVNNDEYLKIGIFQENSHVLVEIDHDLLALPLINKILEALSKDYKTNKITANNLKQIIIKASECEAMVIFKTSDDKKINQALIRPLLNLSFVKSIYQTYDSKKAKSKVYNLIYGFSYITTKIGDFRFLNYPGSFFQVNHYLTKTLYDEIKKNIDGKTLIDAYAGMSSISIYLADKFEEIYSLEINDDSVKSAKKSLIINQIKNIKIIKGDVNKTLNQVIDLADSIIFDPPRKGLDKGVISIINNSKIENVLYVSCNVKTLARDLKLFEMFELKKIIPVRMFPETVEFETIAILRRK